VNGVFEELLGFVTLAAGLRLEGLLGLCRLVNSYSIARESPAV